MFATVSCSIVYDILFSFPPFCLSLLLAALFCGAAAFSPAWMRPLWLALARPEMAFCSAMSDPQILHTVVVGVLVVVVYFLCLCSVMLFFLCCVIS